MLKTLLTLFVLSLAVTGSAQMVASLPKGAAAVKRTAEGLTNGAPISVYRLHAITEFGKFKSNDQEGFTFYDVDSKVEVTLRYEEVRKIVDGYGGYNSFQKRHTDRRKALILSIAVAGLVGALVIAVAESR